MERVGDTYISKEYLCLAVKSCSVRGRFIFAWQRETWVESEPAHIERFGTHSYPDAREHVVHKDVVCVVLSY